MNILYPLTLSQSGLKQACQSVYNPANKQNFMEKLHLPFKAIGIIVLVLMMGIRSEGATYYSRASGNWNTNTTWSLTVGGSAVGSGIFPVAGDIVNITGGRTVTVTANAACATIVFPSNNNNNNTLTINSGITLVVSGTITIPRANSNRLNTVTVGSGILTAANIAFTNGGTGVRHSVTISTGTVSVTGDITGSTGNTSGTISFSGAGLLVVGGTIFNSSDGTLTTFTGSTVEYNKSGNQTLGNFTYSNLTLSGSGTKTTAGVTVNGIFSMEGTASASAAPTYGSSSTLQYKGSSAQVTGIEFPASSFSGSTIKINNSNGVTLNATKNIGTKTLTIGDIVSNSIFEDGGYQLTSTGTINLTSGTYMLGSAVTATAFPAFGTRNFSSSGFVDYSAGVTQVVSSITYLNLTISGAGGATTAGDITVTGILNLSAANPSATQGTLHTGANTLNMGVSSTTTGQGDVTGIVKRTHTFTNGVAYSFGSQYTSITFLGVSGGTKPSWLSCKITIGTAPSWKTEAVQRTYTFAEDVSSTDEVITNLSYLGNELNGNTETNLTMYDFHSGGTIHEHGKSNNDATANWVGLSGLMINYIAPTAILDNKIWALGNSIATKNTWLGVNSTWTDNSNWSAGHFPTSTEAVLIPGSLPNYPTLAAAATALTLEIGAGASLSAGAQTITITGSGGAWINNGTFNAGTGTVIFSKADLTKIVSIAGTTNFYNITINASTYVQPASNSILRIGNLITNDGLFDCESTTNTIEYNKSNTQTVIVPNGANSGYHNLILSGTSAKSFTLDTKIGNDLNIAGSATILQTSTRTITIAGNFSNTSLIAVSFAGTVNYSSTVPQTIACINSTTFKTIGIYNPSGVSLSSSNVTLTNLVIGDGISNSIFSDNGYILNLTGATKSLLMRNGSTLNLGSTTSGTSMPLFTSGSINLASGSTVNYIADVAQTVSTAPSSYGNINLFGSGIKTISAGTLTAAGNLNIESTTTFLTNSTILTLYGNLSGTGNITQGSTMSISGDWINTGTFSPSVSQVTLLGSNKQIAGGTNLTFSSLSISGTYINNTPGPLMITSSLSGFGSLTQSLNSILFINGSIGDGLILNASSNCPNYVNYDGTDQTIRSTNYCNLTISNNGFKILQDGELTVSNQLSIENSSIVSGDFFSMQIGGNLDIGPDASLTISPISTATIIGDLINGNGIDGLKIQSSIDGTGSLVSTTPDINATVERYIEIDQKWHFLSPPVASQEIWPQFAPDPGSDLSWGAYNEATPYNWDFYYYNPNALVASQLYWVNLRKDETGAYNDGADMTSNSNAGYGSATQLSPPKFRTGRGYLVAYTTDWTIDSPTTHTFAGVLNSGNVDVPIYYNSGNTYNLVGNPYPCSIDWTNDGGWVRTCLGPPENQDFWIYNDASGNYGAFSIATKTGTNGVSQNIASGQAFFVKAASSGTLTMTDALKKHSTQVWLKNTNADNTLIHLDLTCSANTYKDEMIVQFDPSFTGGGTQKFNSFYAEAPELYSVKDGNNYSIDRYNTLTDDMKVNIATKTGVAANYTIKVTNIADFTLRDKVYLLDLKTGVKTNLKQTPSYTFAGTPDDDRNRFQLIFGTSIGYEEETSSDITIYASENIIYIRNDKANEPYTVMVSNMLGQIITRTKLAGNTLNQIELNSVPGIYVVTVYSEGSLFSRKVVVK